MANCIRGTGKHSQFVSKNVVLQFREEDNKKKKPAMPALSVGYAKPTNSLAIHLRLDQITDGTRRSGTVLVFKRLHRFLLVIHVFGLD